MNHSYKKLISIIATTILSIGILFLLPENVLDNGVLAAMIGAMLSWGLGPIPEGVKEFNLINKGLYFIGPTAWFFAMVYIFSLPAGVFYLVGFAIVQIFRKINSEQVT